MRIRKLTADLIYTNEGDPVRNGVIVLDSVGQILALDDMKDHDQASVERLSGVIVPGYVNAHCHLELSHMLGKIATGTGLLPFIKSVVSQRNSDAEIIADSIATADREMVSNGIVAVGDISNTTDSFGTKTQSNIRYYTFVEMFDLMNDAITDRSFEQYYSVFQKAPLNKKDKKSAVPHAPYSVSPSLFAKINQLNQLPSTISVHSLETQAEIDLFANGRGGFPPLFKSLGLSMTAKFPTGTTPMQYLLNQLDNNHRILFVHNTLADSEDILAAQNWSDNVYWVTCPNANLYIENRLPDYNAFSKNGAYLCLGTDSLSSNWQLSIFEEMRTVARFQSEISTKELIKWSSLHGAMALGMDDVFGSITIGKRPGLNLLTLNSAGRIDQHSTSHPIT